MYIDMFLALAIDWGCKTTTSQESWMIHSFCCETGLGIKGQTPPWFCCSWVDDPTPRIWPDVTTTIQDLWFSNSEFGICRARDYVDKNSDSKPKIGCIHSIGQFIILQVNTGERSRRIQLKMYLIWKRVCSWSDRIVRNFAFLAFSHNNFHRLPK
jgi:hypothetical protein